TRLCPESDRSDAGLTHRSKRLDQVTDGHYTFFGAQFRGLRPRLPFASHTVSRRSHFGSATDLVASLWSGGIDRRTPTHPLGNNDEFQGVSPLFQRPELLSARPAPGSASQSSSLKNLRPSLSAKHTCDRPVTVPGL